LTICLLHGIFWLTIEYNTAGVPQSPEARGATGEAGPSPALSRNCRSADHVRVRARLPASAGTEDNLRGKVVVHGGYASPNSPSPRNVRGRVVFFRSALSPNAWERAFYVHISIHERCDRHALSRPGLASRRGRVVRVGQRVGPVDQRRGVSDEGRKCRAS
jgi:hypothetical protein